VSEPQRVIVSAPGKINLFLHAGEKRDDGYHDLQSLVVFSDIGDSLMLETAAVLSLEVDGPFAAELARLPDNLVLRAARALALACGRVPHANIRLTKNLPVASGLGGGSADAAATLRGLNALWDLKLAPDELAAIGLTLGSDVPACLMSAPLWMEGRGDRIARLARFPRLPIVLVNPGISVSTKDVFEKLEARRGVAAAGPNGFEDAKSVLEFLSTTANDLEAPARQLAPEIRHALRTLTDQNADYARMSGSGATCIAIFASDEKARAAAEKIAAQHEAWWVKAAHVAPAYMSTQ
jgi:4-diphosphocytidyl-2-C-methyl-D-erythritol kinase